jgi:membrane protein
MNTSWTNVLRYVKESVFKDRLVVVAPGVAFFLMLGLMPGVAALILVYGLISDPVHVKQQLDEFGAAVPPDALAMLTAQVQRVTEERVVAGWGAVISVALAIWAGSYAMGVIVAALNIAFDTDESRGFIRLTVLRLVLMIAAVVIGIVAVGVLVVVPLLADALPLPDPLTGLLMLLRWPLLLLLAIAGLAMLYRFGPDRAPPAFHWLSWGSATAALLWVVASSLFSGYVARLDVYDALFGALATIVVVMLWLLISAYAILLGAEVDAAIERERRG